jgi:hypothetical protein
MARATCGIAMTAEERTIAVSTLLMSHIMSPTAKRVTVHPPGPAFANVPHRLICRRSSVEFGGGEVRQSRASQAELEMPWRS